MKNEEETVIEVDMNSVRSLELRVNRLCDGCRGTGLTITNKHIYDQAHLQVTIGVCRCVGIWTRP